MHCVIYCRVSTEEQASTGNSLRSQQTRCEIYADRQKWNVIDTFQDVMSGKIMERPGLLEAIETVPPGGALLVSAISRVSRNEEHLGHIVAQLHSKNAKIISITEDTSTDARIAELGKYAQMESEMTSQRVKAGLEYKKAIGEVIGRPPYGYMYRNKKLIPHLEEQNVIQVVKELRQEGCSMNRIIERLEELKMAPRSGHWHPSMIARIIDGK